jgi:hypothetical protein
VQHMSVQSRGATSSCASSWTPICRARLSARSPVETLMIALSMVVRHELGDLPGEWLSVRCWLHVTARVSQAAVSASVFMRSRAGRASVRVAGYSSTPIRRQA